MVIRVEDYSSDTEFPRKGGVLLRLPRTTNLPCTFWNTINWQNGDVLVAFSAVDTDTFLKKMKADKKTVDVNGEVVFTVTNGVDGRPVGSASIVPLDGGVKYTSRFYMGIAGGSGRTVVAAGIVGMREGKEEGGEEEYEGKGRRRLRH